MQTEGSDVLNVRSYVSEAAIGSVVPLLNVKDKDKVHHIHTTH